MPADSLCRVGDAVFIAFRCIFRPVTVMADTSMRREIAAAYVMTGSRIAAVLAVTAVVYRVAGEGSVRAALSGDDDHRNPGICVAGIVAGDDSFRGQGAGGRNAVGPSGLIGQLASVYAHGFRLGIGGAISGGDRVVAPRMVA